MIKIIVTIPKGQNFTPNSLIYKYCKANGIEYKSTPYFTNYITIDGHNYTYHHYNIKPAGDIETVELYLSLFED